MVSFTIFTLRRYSSVGLVSRGTISHRGEPFQFSTKARATVRVGATRSLVFGEKYCFRFIRAIDGSSQARTISFRTRGHSSSFYNCLIGSGIIFVHEIFRVAMDNGTTSGLSILSFCVGLTSSLS